MPYCNWNVSIVAKCHVYVLVWMLGCFSLIFLFCTILIRCSSPQFFPLLLQYGRHVLKFLGVLYGIRQFFSFKSWHEYKPVFSLSVHWSTIMPQKCVYISLHLLNSLRLLPSLYLELMITRLEWLAVAFFENSALLFSLRLGHEHVFKFSKYKNVRRLPSAFAKEIW